jgi:hypothetical protein
MEGIGDLATLWRIKGSSSIIFSQVKSFGLYCSISYPMFLLAVTFILIIYTLKVACTLACVRFCTLLVFVCVVLSTYLSWEIKYVYVGLHTIYLCWAVLLLFDILSCRLSFWEINGLSYFGGVICFVHFTILKLCIHEEYHLVLIYLYYLFSMWYVLLMRNSNSIMSINFSSWFCLPLVLK